MKNVVHKTLKMSELHCLRLQNIKPSVIKNKLLALGLKVIAKMARKSFCCCCCCCC